MKPDTGAPWKALYQDYYDDRVSAWRERGADFKARRLLGLSASLQGARALDCGAGDGAVLERLAQARHFGELSAVEISASGLQRLRARNIPGITAVDQFDGYHVPHADDRFDVAIVCHVIEHVEHPRLLLRELMRVSRYQLFEIPLEYASDVDEAMGPKMEIGHINVFTPALFRFLLKSEGLVIRDERLSRSPRELIRYNWYQNQGRRFSFNAEVRLLLSPFVQRARQALLGKRRYAETGYDTFTVLTERPKPR